MTDATRSQFSAVVAANVPLCREHYRLELLLPEFPPTEPGQFIQIACRDMDVEDWLDTECEHDWAPGTKPHLLGRELQSPLATLRRPFSLAGRRDTPDGVILEIIHRVVGVGTDWLGKLNYGDAVGILGPLGNRFNLPDPGQRAILVGGGVGIPPMLYLAQALAGRPAVAFCGVTTADLLPLSVNGSAPLDAASPTMCVGEFAECGIPSVISSDDGSVGVRGFVTAALERYLDRIGFNISPSPGTPGEGRGEGSAANRPMFANQNQPSPYPSPGVPGEGTSGHTAPVLYTCGPEPMMKRVAEIALRRGLECQVAVERAMACGMGTCQSCCIRVRASGRADGRDWVYQLACTHGPIFSAADLLW
jgi:dihydroorotate dehydrogenase electron transfer subunit